MSDVKQSGDHFERIQEQFTRQAEVYEKMAGVADDRIHAAAVTATGAKPSDRVLDVACGPGYMTAAFGAKCRVAFGVDATELFLEHARANAARRGLDNVRFIRGNALAIPLRPNSFDMVACRAAFHHFPEPAPVLAQMVRAAVRRGRIAIYDQLSSDDPAKSDYHNRIERLCDPTHVKALTRGEFHSMFEAYGLRLVAENQRAIDYRLPEWIAHGGPPPEREAEIVRMMTDSIERDLSGLNVRRQDAEIFFSHVGVFFLLERA